MPRMQSAMRLLLALVLLSSVTAMLTGCRETVPVASAPTPLPCLVIPRSLLNKPSLPTWLPSPGPITISSPPLPCKPPSSTNTSKP